jgi:hypothetical protein
MHLLEAFSLFWNRWWKRTDNILPLWKCTIPFEQELGFISNSFKGKMLLDLFNDLI